MRTPIVFPNQETGFDLRFNPATMEISLINIKGGLAGSYQLRLQDVKHLHTVLESCLKYTADMSLAAKVKGLLPEGNPLKALSTANIMIILNEHSAGWMVDNLDEALQILEECRENPNR